MYRFTPNIIFTIGEDFLSNAKRRLKFSIFPNKAPTFLDMAGGNGTNNYLRCGVVAYGFEQVEGTVCVRNAQ